MNNRPSRWKGRSSRKRDEKGITLVTTLMLLLLLVGMSLTMVLAVSSESLINGFYGRYRGSFYAADSGVAAARQPNGRFGFVVTGVLSRISRVLHARPVKQDGDERPQVFRNVVKRLH